MPRLAEVNVDHDLKSGATTTGLRISHGSNAVKLKHKIQNKATVLELTAPKWSLAYDLASKDLTVETKRSTKLGEVKVKQRLPQGKLALFPSPEVKLSAVPISSKQLRHTADLSYDFQTSVARVETELTVKGRYKLKLQTDSKLGLKGIVSTATVKVGSKSSIALQHSAAGGQQITAEAEPFSALRVKGVYKAKSQECRLELQPKLGKHLRLSATATCNAKAVCKPALMFGATFTP